MARIFLHIGAHKTGTTAVQSSFDRNRDMLAGHGVIYPRTNWYHYSQHRLAFALNGHRDPQIGDIPSLSDELEALNTVIASAPEDARIFISSEVFFATRHDAMQQLKHGLACDDVRILAVVRRPDDLLLSIYNQNIKAPQNEFKQPLQRVLKDPPCLSLDMDQPGCVRCWADVFGYQNLMLQSYETVDVISMCLDLLEVPESNFDRGPRVNSSVSAAVLEVMRISKAAGMDSALRKKLYQHAHKLFADHPMQDLSGADRQRILEHYEAEFEALFAQFGQENPYRADRVDPSWEAGKTPLPAHLYVRLVEKLLKDRQA